MTTDTTIPAQYIDLCEKIALLAREAGLRSIGVNFTPGLDSGWHHPIQLHWEYGRHGDSSGKFIVSSQVTIQAQIPTTVHHDHT